MVCADSNVVWLEKQRQKATSQPMTDGQRDAVERGTEKQSDSETQ